MDRVKSSMQQVPNAIPKVIRRTGGANSLELEKENFERGQVRRGRVLSFVSVQEWEEKLLAERRRWWEDHDNSHVRMFAASSYTFKHPEFLSSGQG